ncbi:MAG: GatB/YqeY domain-containing protein [Beijerinckiaceae bacterium]|nr:GatB/YqeY domain-containing protein [Beijerinckiaceae bacterium]
MMREDISEKLKTAMKAGDKRRVSTLRMIQSTLKDRDIEARTSDKPVSNDDILAMMQKMIKSRQESADIYAKNDRPELAQQENEEIAIISEFLPKQMSDDEVKEAIAAAIADTGAESMKDMGKVIGALKAKFTGQMDFGKASAAVKAALNN